VWLAAIVAVAVIAWVALGWVWGLVGAGATLVVSEGVERRRRRRRQVASGAPVGSPLRSALTSRRSTRRSDAPRRAP
jgi:hypothetical protein